MTEVQNRSGRLPLVVYILAAGTFLMLTTEFIIAGILPEMSADLGIGLGQTGSLITVFAVGMIIGAPLMSLLTLRISKKLTLVTALIIFVFGHVAVALGSNLLMLSVARFITAIATGAFWAVAAVVGAKASGPILASRAVGVVAAGGSLATVLGVPIGALIAQQVGWRGTFWALAAAAIIALVFIIKLVAADAPETGSSSLLDELSDLKSGRLWLVLAACVTTTGGVLAAYSYISPTLQDYSGVSASLVPVVLTIYGLGSFIGTLLGGRWGGDHPSLLTIGVPAVTTGILLLFTVFGENSWIAVALVALLGLFGLSANSVLIHLAVKYSGRAETMGSALSVASFNTGTAIGTSIAGASLNSSLGMIGPSVVGTVIVALTLIPTIMLAVLNKRTAQA